MLLQTLFKIVAALVTLLIAVFGVVYLIRYQHQPDTPSNSSIPAQTVSVQDFDDEQTVLTEDEPQPQYEDVEKHEENIEKIEEKAEKKKENKRLDANFSHKLNIKYINSFYSENLNFFDLDQIVETEADHELDEDRMKDWINKMKERWDKFTEKEQKSKRYNGIKKYGWKKKEDLPQNLYEWFAIKFIDELSNNFITWKKFREQVKSVAEDVQKLFQSKKWTTIYFLVAGNVEKSNGWIFFVFWKYLKDYIPSGTVCKFISHAVAPYSADSGDKITDYFEYSKVPYKNDDVLVLYFDDMSYSGSQVKHQLEYFEKRGYPAHLYLVIPYISHRAKRNVTRMDSTMTKMQSYYTQNYVDGHIGYFMDENIKEPEFFEQSPVKFFPNTKVLVEIPTDNRNIPLGNTEGTTVAAMMPFKVADNASILCTQIAFSLGPICNDTVNQTFVDKFEPVSFIKGHTYSDEIKLKIKKKLFRNTKYDAFGDEGEDKGEYNIDCFLAYDNDMLPISAFYKNNKYVVKKGDTDETVEFNSNDSEYKKRGIFNLIEAASNL